ncbi:carboxypeptidase regulatory-like domain-containing protein [Bacteroidota bacterium]
MKKIILYSILFVISIILINPSTIFSQQLTQSIRGKVIDNITESPLPGANVVVLNTDPLMGVSTDIDGKFILENVPIGIVKIRVSFIGFNEIELPPMELRSGKEMVLTIPLTEKVFTGKTFEIRAYKDKLRPLNSMSTVSSRGFTVDETKRYAGSNNDVARMAANFAGVRIQNDARNDIVIRGNSPMGLLWRMEGVDIPNPNHYGTIGLSGGPVSMLNNNQLAYSDFMTAAFPAEYGNAFAGVFDLRMRNGNDQKHEFLGQIGFNGFEAGAEGPISRKRGSSYLINFRYSTLELFELMGIEFGTGTAIPKYMDGSFKINLPNNKIGNISIFGLAGRSSISSLYSTDDTTKTNFYNNPGKDAGYDLHNGSDMIITGLNHIIHINKSSFTHFNLSYSFHKNYTRIDSIYLKTNEKHPSYRNDATEKKIFSSFYYKKKLSTKDNFKLGVSFSRSHYIIADSIFDFKIMQFRNITDYTGSVYILQPYIAWQHKFNDKLSINGGLHYQYFSMNSTSSLEPRLGLKWAVTSVHSIGLAYGMHSQILPIVVYFNQTRLPDGSYSRMNENLDMIRSHHFVAGYDWVLNETMRFKAEAYYQYLTDVAVDAHKNDSYSMLNQGSTFALIVPDTLKNDGTGKNYGFELTLEQFLNKGLYYLITASFYESKYTGSDKVERYTAYSGGYTFNGLIGKEFQVLKNKSKGTKQRYIKVDTKVTWAGGQRYTPINEVESKKRGNAVYIDDEAFTKHYPDYLRVDLRIGFKESAKKFSWEFALDFNNVTNNENVYIQYFNKRTNSLDFINQLPFMIYPQFRIEF